MWWPLGMHSGERPTPFNSKLSLPAEGAVVLLGAGASASVGAPLMRGFIDRARDYLKLGLFNKEDIADVEASIKLFDDLRAHFRITEEDIENVENLLSLAELADLIPNLPISSSLPKGIADSVRRFVEAVLVKSVRLPAPDSPKWLGINTALPHKRIVASLAHYKEKISIITLNYDCVLEYICYCMGVPFTYNREYGDGAEILKLHGSINWFVCPTCPAPFDSQVVELQHNPIAEEVDSGTLEPKTKKCPNCSSPLRPLIVPPTWAKPLDHKVLRDTWSRAFEVLSTAETLVTVGYSLPVGDPKVRELLHVGLSSAKLRQAMIVLGNDEEASSRWGRLFRESWRGYRLDIRMKNFEEIAHDFLFRALSISESVFGNPHMQLLPLNIGPCLNESARKSLEEKEKEISAKVDWVNVAYGLREGSPVKHSTTELYRKILSDLGLDWKPSASILPTHGAKLAKP